MDGCRYIIVTNALSSVTFIAGDEKLVLNYQQAQQECFDTRDGFFSLTGTPFCKKLAFTLMQDNLHEFKPNLSIEKEKINAYGIKKNFTALSNRF